MASSKADICRKALSLLKTTKTLANLEQPTDELEIACDRWFDTCREQMLSAFNWTFAKSRFIAPQNSETPLFDYTKQFVLPSDFLQLESIYLGEYITKEEIDFRIEGRNLLINTEDATLNIVYIKNLDQTELYPEYFVNALVTYLALNLSNEINASDTDLQRLKSWHDNSLIVAKSQDSLKRSVRLNRGKSTFKSGYEQNVPSRINWK